MTVRHATSLQTLVLFKLKFSADFRNRKILKI